MNVHITVTSQNVKPLTESLQSFLVDWFQARAIDVSVTIKWQEENILISVLCNSNNMAVALTGAVKRLALDITYQSQEAA